jgi:hypothetical protein
VMNALSVNQDVFRLTATVPEDLVGMPAEGEGEWAAWLGLASTPVAGRNAVVLVSISVTVLNASRGAPEASDEIAARLRARHPEGTARIEQFTTTAGNPAVAVRRTVTQRVNGRDVTTGQAQALVAYPRAGALGVVSGVALDPDDLDRAVVLVTGIAAGMTVTCAPAAA